MVSAVISDTGGLTTTVYIGDHDRMEAPPPFCLADRPLANLPSTTDTTGDDNSGPQYYFPYGETRSDAEAATEYRYTGQRWQSALGLYYYNARWYDPTMRRFVQADTIVPGPASAEQGRRLRRKGAQLADLAHHLEPLGGLQVPFEA